MFVYYTPYSTRMSLENKHKLMRFYNRFYTSRYSSVHGFE